MDDSSHQLVFDPPAGPLMRLFGLCSEVMLAVLEVGWVSHEEVFDREKLDGGEDCPAYFGCPRLQEFYVISYSHLRAHADV